MLIKCGWMEAKVDGTIYCLDEDGSYRPIPHFFVSFLRGRRLNKEMTVQHMHDLFGGVGGDDDDDGGGGQVAMVNDCKAPGKK
eukprot:1639683-Ditylum_brightwellii.AAC.1